MVSLCLVSPYALQALWVTAMFTDSRAMLMPFTCICRLGNSSGQHWLVDAVDVRQLAVKASCMDAMHKLPWVGKPPSKIVQLEMRA